MSAGSRIWGAVSRCGRSDGRVQGLGLDARRLFIAIASGMIDSDQAHIELDCSQVDALDEQTLGMLVTVAHNAQRRGQRVVVDAASEGVRRDLNDAGVGYLFAWSA